MRLRSNRDVFQHVQTRGLAMNRAQQPRELMRLRQETLIEMFEQLARNSLRVDEHFPQRQMPDGPFQRRVPPLPDRMMY